MENLRYYFNIWKNMYVLFLFLLILGGCKAKKLIAYPVPAPLEVEYEKETPNDPLFNNNPSINIAGQQLGLYRYNQDYFRELKDFPIPYPKPSSNYVFPKAIVRKARNMAEMDSILINSLDKVGYSNFSYYKIPNGYAMVTSIENIDHNAFPVPSPGRWGVKSTSIQVFSIGDYLRALFNANKGYYRSIVFLVTNKHLNHDGVVPTPNQIDTLVDSGSTTLPHEAKYFSLDDSYRLEALIYEFEKPEYGNAKLIVPCSHSGKSHLERALILTQIN